MTNIVVFGKPRAFESFEFVFDGNNSSAENTHREPLLKPKQYEEPILHYFVRESYAGLEYYTRARGFESERDGIVFGVSMKSTTDFNIIDTISYILQPFWIDFASALLDETNKFVEDSIVNRLKNTQWSQLEIDKIQSTSLHHPINTPQKDILLLVLPKLDDIKLVEHSIKEYEDVYLSDNPSVFKEQMNDIVLREAGNQIFIIEDGKIVPLHEEVQPEPHPEPQISVFRRIAQLPGWGNRRGPQDTKDKHRKTSNGEIEHRDFWLVTSISFFSLALIIAAVIHFWPNRESPLENQTNEGQTTDATELVNEEQLGDTGDECNSTDGDEENYDKFLAGISVKLKAYDSPIENSLPLKPKILPDTCTRIYPHDINYKVSDETLVSIDCANDYNLIVKKHPSNDTKVTVQAFNHGILLGEQTYTIAKAKEIPGVPSDNPSLEQRLVDLRKEFDKKKYYFVILKCDKIIKGNSAEKYKQKAAKLKEEAQNALNNNEAKSNF